MPFLSPTSDVFRQEPEIVDFVSKLPPADLLQGAQVSPEIKALLQNAGATLSFRQTQNALQIAKSVLKWDAINFGIRSVEISALEDVISSTIQLINAGGSASVADYVELVNGVLNATWELLDVALSSFSAVPIVGIIVQVAQAIVQGIVLLLRQLEAEKKKKQKVAGDARAYDRQSDEFIAQTILAASRSWDWTPLFMPFSTKPWKAWRVSYTENGVANGYGFGPPELSPSEVAGYGCFPQLSERFGYWQYADKYGKNEDMFRVHPIGNTQLFPSCTQAATVLWQRVMDYGARMFSVDMWAVESAWRDFFGNGMELAAHEFKNGHLDLATNVSEACAYTWLFAKGAAHGRCGGTKQYDRYNCNTMPDEYLEVSINEKALRYPVSYGELIKYVRREVWQPRARAALGTLICAYVDDSKKFPGIRNADPKTRQLWLDMRKKLLHSRAVRDVEIDLIPDQEYRTAVKAAQSHSQELAAGPPPEPKPGSPFQILDLSLVIDVDPPPDPPTGLDPGVPNLGEDPSGSGVAVAAIAALGLFALAR